MLFNSLEFIIFVLVVFILYWLVIDKNLKLQNILLLLASYVFYGWWDWRFLCLLILLSFLNYSIGIRIDSNEIYRKKKIWLIIGLFIDIGILCVFKYFNFFIDSFVDFVSIFGYSLQKSTLRIILPLGISFYIFISLSYIIEIFKKNLKANRNIVEVLLSLSFFPIILAGPIQRPSSLLPQISIKREFNYDLVADGLRQILWGLFAKTVIADNLVIYVNDIFLNYSNYSGSSLLFGAIFYSVQIYADFSGYSNVAIGVAKLFGFTLMRNFAYPYFSRDITEFWKKWHISLTTWFRDYLFLPISFAISWRIKNGKVFFIKTDLFIYIVASTIVWFLTGLWHGANYTFIVWGMINGFYLIIYHIQKRPRNRLLKKLGISKNHSLIVIIETLITLFIVMLAWVIFRADNVNQALMFINKMFSKSLFHFPEVNPAIFIFLTIVFVLSEWLQRNKQHALQIDKIKYRIIRWGIYFGTIVLILYAGGSQQDFIYFQF
jgi:alginate O-acetyltransferase complex protein AlgI